MTRHGVEGWVLEDMDWDPETGLATFEYFNRSRGETRIEVRYQPVQDSHLHGYLPRGQA